MLELVCALPLRGRFQKPHHSTSIVLRGLSESPGSRQEDFHLIAELGCVLKRVLLRSSGTLSTPGGQTPSLSRPQNYMLSVILCFNCCLEIVLVGTHVTRTSELTKQGLVEGRCKKHAGDTHAVLRLLV